MEAFQQRVIDEKRELDEKLAKLDAFLWSPTFEKLDFAEKTRLIGQSWAMCQYSQILGQRIAAFK